MSDYEKWCEENNCQHGHCPYECEHPQPFKRDGQLICGKCWFVDGLVTVMIPCTPEHCD